MNYMMHMSIIIFLLLAVTLIYSSTSKSKIAERNMKMVILSKDKTKCGEYNRIAVQRNYGNSKDKKFSLVGSVDHQSDILDNYATKEEAIAALEKVFAAYQNGEKTYVM